MLRDDVELVRQIVKEELAKLPKPAMEPKAEPVVIPVVEITAVEEVLTKKHKP